jgi:hypothetical protein
MTIPTDEQFFSKTEDGKPDVAFLKNHFFREGRIKEEHALYIIEKATQILRAEPNVLSVDAPVTGATFTYHTRIQLIYNPCSQSAVIFMVNMCVSPRHSPAHVPGILCDRSLTL